MTTFLLPAVSSQIEHRLASAVRDGLASRPKRLPPWLFYDEAGSRLFDQITELPEYYLTRTERAILAAHAERMIARAAEQTGNEDVYKRQALRVSRLAVGSSASTSAGR